MLEGTKLGVQSTTGTVFFSTNMTRSHIKLQGTGQRPSGTNLTSGGNLPNLAAGPRTLASSNNGVRTDSRWTGDQAEQTCERGEGAKPPVDQCRTKQGGAAEPSEPAKLGKSSSGLQFH